jgi:hypothetical protein
MKDSEKTTLRAFLLALYQQQSDQTLPDATLDMLQNIAKDIKHRVTDLDPLAKSTPALAESYRQARQTMSRIASERSLGKDFLAAPYDDQPDTEKLNIASNKQSEIVEFQAFLDCLDEGTVRQVLSSENPIQAIKAQIHSEKS